MYAGTRTKVYRNMYAMLIMYAYREQQKKSTVEVNNLNS